MICCPACKAPLTDSEVRAILGAFGASKRKVKTGGRNGGRPRKDDPLDPRKPTPNPAVQSTPAKRNPAVAKLASEIEEIQERTHLVAFEDL